MTPEILASLIIKFCSIKEQKEIFETPEKAACAFFLMNCSVDKSGIIRGARFESCKDAFLKNKSKIIKEYGG